MVGNGWRAGVVRFLLLLLATMTQPSTSASPVSCVRLTTLQWVAELMRPLAAHVGPGQWPRQPSCIPPARDLWDHWRLATAAPHPLQYPARLAPGFVECIELQLRWRADLPGSALRWFVKFSSWLQTGARRLKTGGWSFQLTCSRCTLTPTRARSRRSPCLSTCWSFSVFRACVSCRTTCPMVSRSQAGSTAARGGHLGLSLFLSHTQAGFSSPQPPRCAWEASFGAS